jgi:hypothetical protein
LFDAIDIDHFSPPILHLLLGLANYIYANLVAELQAGYESYTAEYFELEAAMAKAGEELAKIKEERRRHELFSGNNIKYWKVSTCRAYCCTEIQTHHKLTNFVALCCAKT